MPQCLQCGQHVLHGLLARHGICAHCCFQKAWEEPVIASKPWVTHSPFHSQDDSQINPYARFDDSVDWFQAKPMSHSEYQQRLDRMLHVPIPAINGGRGESYENFLHIAKKDFDHCKHEISDIITKMTDPSLLTNFRASNFPNDELSNVMAAGFLFAPLCFDLGDANPEIFRVAGTWRKQNGELHGCNNPCGSWWAANIGKSLIQHRHIYAVQVPWNAIGGVTSYQPAHNSLLLASLTTPQTTSYYSKADNRENSVIFCGGGLQFNGMRTVNPHLPLNFVYKTLSFPSPTQQTDFKDIERYFEIAILVQGLKFISAQKSGVICDTTPLSLKTIILRDQDMIGEYPRATRLELCSIIDAYFGTIFKMINTCSDTNKESVQIQKNNVLNFFGMRYRRLTELLIGLPTARMSRNQKNLIKEKFGLVHQPVHTEHTLSSTGVTEISSPHINTFDRHNTVRERFRDAANRALYHRRSSVAQFRQVVLLAVNRAVRNRLSGKAKANNSDLL